MEAKHTPGPWRAAIDCNEWAVYGGDALLGRAVVATACVAVPGDAVSAETLGNGALIAVAPDLLAVARMVCGHYSGSLDFQPPYVAAARAALDKMAEEEMGLTLGALPRGAGA